MSARLAADTVLVVHFLYVLFVVFGGVLVAWRRRFAWLHLPALAWGIWIEFTHGICPLTPLENRLREAAGDAGYPGDFIGHYLLALVYPAKLTPETQQLLALAVLAFNVLPYGWVLQRRRCRP